MTPQQLKSSILQRAIEGRLVEQRAEEGTAGELIKEIRAEKEKMIKEGKIKKGRPLPPITEEEKPFDIPEGWEWVRLGEIVTVCGGKRIPVGTRLSEEDTGHKYIRVADMKENTVLLDDIKYVTDEIYKKISRYTISVDDVYITVAGTIGSVGTIPMELNNANLTENADKLIIYSLNKQFVVHCLNSPLVQAQIKDATTKVGQPKLAIMRIESLVVPLPPFLEQLRIVSKIGDLLPLIEQYEKAYTKLTKLNTRFPEAMKKSLLQYAIQGKLVEQRQDEGTAEDLVKKIQAEKKRLIAEKKIKKTKSLPPITEEEKPFDIPDGWEWVRLGEICTYDQTKEKISREDIQPDMWSLDMEDIEKGTGRIININMAKNRKIAGDKVIFHRGDILYSKLRPYLQKILIAPADGICTSELVPFQCYGEVSSNYMTWLLRSPYVNQVVNTASYGVKMPRVSKETMVSILVPLPPLAEQHRIVAKLEELLPLCERLK